MRNKLKIAAIVVALVAGIVLYKQHWDKNHRDDDDEKEAKKPRSRSHGDLPN